MNLTNHVGSDVNKRSKETRNQRILKYPTPVILRFSRVTIFTIRWRVRGLRSELREIGASDGRLQARR